MSTKPLRIKNSETVAVGYKKTGKVLCFQLAECELPGPLLREICDGKRIFDHFVSGFDRYIVEVMRVSKKGEKLPSEYRAPIAGKLEKEAEALLERVRS